MEAVLEGLLNVLPEFKGTTIKDLKNPKPPFTRKLIWTIILYFATDIGLAPCRDCPSDIQLVLHVNNFFINAGIICQISIFDIISPTKKTTMALFHMVNLLLNLDINSAKTKDPIAKVKHATMHLVKVDEEIEQLKNTNNNIMVNNGKLSDAISKVEKKIVKHLKLTEDDDAVLKLKKSNMRQKNELEYLDEDILNKKLIIVDDDQYDELKSEVDKIIAACQETVESTEIKNIDNELLGHFKNVKSLLIDIEHKQSETNTEYNIYKNTENISEEKCCIIQTIKEDIEKEIATILPIVSEMNTLKNKIIETKGQFEMEKTNLENQIHKAKLDIQEHINLKKKTLKSNESKENEMKSMIKKIETKEAECFFIKDESENNYNKLLASVHNAHEKISLKIKLLISKINDM